VEFSQLYHAPWIDTIRAARIGALVLGSTFNAPVGLLDPRTREPVRSAWDGLERFR
jgi:hypothetical protein